MMTKLPKYLVKPRTIRPFICGGLNKPMAQQDERSLVRTVIVIKLYRGLTGERSNRFVNKISRNKVSHTGMIPYPEATKHKMSCFLVSIPGYNSFVIFYITQNYWVTLTVFRIKLAKINEQHEILRIRNL